MVQTLASKTKPVSYRVKDKTTCPVCRHEFQREQLHSGGGRLIAGKLTNELRRTYEISKKFGRIYPPAYSIITCPKCLYSSFSGDFNMVAPEEVGSLQAKIMERRNLIEKILGPLDFNEDRNLVLGAASYLLAYESYQQRNAQVAPTPKKALCAIRGAWFFGDLHEEFPDKSFDKIRDFLYLKAVKNYSPTLDILSNGREPLEQFQNILGPDTDQNWGFDGVVYLNGYLTNKYLEKLASDPKEQLDILEKSRRHLGKLYGMGKASKNKPTVIIDLAKELYEGVTERMEEMKEKYGIDVSG